MTTKEMQDAILKWKKEQDCCILAHCYQTHDILEVADFVGDEPYYPVNNERNNQMYQEYQKLAETVPNVIFGGRLGQYKYYDMDKVIAAALETVQNEFGA